MTVIESLTLTSPTQPTSDDQRIIDTFTKWFPRDSDVFWDFQRYPGCVLCRRAFIATLVTNPDAYDRLKHDLGLDQVHGSV